MKYLQDPRNRTLTFDCLFLCIIVILSVILYVHQLGFYSDDWTYLKALDNSEDQSIRTLLRAIHGDNAPMRPIQSLYLALLYYCFGANPLGYHIVNGLILIGFTLLFYFLLRELKFNNAISLTVPLIYVLLPHYSTDRFWIAAFQVNLSTLFYFLSFLADLRSLKSNAIIYKTIAIVSLLISVLAYETILPLFFLNLLIVGYLVWSAKKQRLLPVFLHTAVTVLSLAFLFAYKAVTDTRFNSTQGTLNRIKDNLLLFINFGDYGIWGLNFKQAIYVNFLDHGFALPRTVWLILKNHFDWSVLLLSVALGVMVFTYLYIRFSSELKFLNTREFLILIPLGFIVFWLGYAIFFITPGIQLATTGIANRVAHASAIGIAILYVGVIGILSCFLKHNLNQSAFSLLIAILCFCGCFIINTQALFWETAYKEEQRIIDDFKQQFKSYPTGSVIFLDGECPYVGPAIVFEANWDFPSALNFFYRRQDIRADVVKTLKVREDGLSTYMYGKETKYYYNENLLIDNATEKRVYRIPDVAAATEYFGQHKPNGNCSNGEEGIGIRIY